MTIEKEIAFDPYHKWLGIPKVQRPPTHYQLLGLAQGETDAEVIEEAAIRQTTHLRAYQVGAHADDCTKLLNEISSARQVLVNPQKRQDYDSKLAQLAAKRAAAQEANGGAKKTAVVVAPIVESAFADLSDDDPTPASKPRRDAAKPTKSGKSGKRPAAKPVTKGFSQTMILAAAGGAGMLIIGIVGIVAFLISPPPPPPVPQPPVIANNNPPKGQPPVVVNPPPKVLGGDPKPPMGDPKPPAVDPNPPVVDPNPLVKALDPVPGGPLRRLRGSLLRAPAKNLLATGDGRIFYSGYPTVLQFDPARNQHLMAAEFPKTGPRGLRFALAPDGKTMYVGSPDTNRLDAFGYVSPLRQIANFPGAGEVSELALSRDGTMLVTGSYNGTVWSWNTATHQPLKELKSHPRPVHTIVFSRDGTLVATMCDQIVQVWNLRENRLASSTQNILKGTSMDFTPDGKNLLVASPNGLHSGAVDGLFWNPLKTGKDLFLRIAFANDKTLVGLVPNGVTLYEWPSLRTLRNSFVAGNSLDTLALSPDGQLLFAGHSVPKLDVYAVDDSAVLKPYVDPSNAPANPTNPAGNGSFVGAWHFQTKPTGSTKVDIVVRNVGGVHSAQIELHRLSATYRARVDLLRSENGKLRGTVLADAKLPLPWSNLAEMTLDLPNNDMMRAEFRGDRIVPYTLQRQDSGDMPPPKMPVVPVTPPKNDPPPVVVRVDVPAEEKIKEITATVRDTYKSDYAKKTPAERADFAERLLKLALESKNDPADRYVLCCEARDLAAAAGKWPIVADAFEQLEAGFKVDLLPQKEAALQLVLKSGINKESATEATEAALQGISDAIAADQLPLAGSFLSIAGAAAVKSQSLPHVSLFKRADAELKLINQEADAVKKARETLKTMPNDAAANLAVGRYEALRRGDWEPAIPLLAKGGDAELASAAHKELDAPKDGAAQQKVADEWWTLAEKEKDSTWIRAALQNRAAYWYRQAAAQVTGLSLTLVNERLKTIEEAPSPIHPGGGGASAELKSLRGHKGAVTSLHLTLDGKRLFSGSLDATVKSWDLKLAKNLTNYPTLQPIYALAFSPNGRYLALGFRDTMKVVDVDPLAVKGRFSLPSGQAWPSAYWIDDEKIGMVYAGGFGYAYVNNGTSGSGPHSVRASGVIMSPDSRQLVTIGEETYLCNSPLAFGNRSRISLNEPSTAAAFAPASSTIAFALADKKIQLFDSQSRSLGTHFEGAAAVTRCMAFTPAGDRLISGGDDGVVRIWEVSTGKELRRFGSGSKGITSLILTRDGKQIITGGNDGVIRVWAMPREKLATKTAALTSGGN